MSALADDGPVLLTWEEYVKFEEVNEGRRHELIRGRARLMLERATRSRRPGDLRPGPPVTAGSLRRVFVQNRKIRTCKDTGYYPDLLLRCGTGC